MAKTVSHLCCISILLGLIAVSSCEISTLTANEKDDIVSLANFFLLVFAAKVAGGQKS